MLWQARCRDVRVDKVYTLFAAPIGKNHLVRRYRGLKTLRLKVLWLLPLALRGLHTAGCTKKDNMRLTTVVQEALQARTLNSFVQRRTKKRKRKNPVFTWVIMKQQHVLPLNTLQSMRQLYARIWGQDA